MVLMPKFTTRRPSIINDAAGPWLGYNAAEMGE
jgi:hypothetical protein